MRRWAWIWLPLAFFVTCAGWAVASPLGAAPDDDYHLSSIWCAQGERAGVCVDPQVTPAVRLVPVQVVQSHACYAFKPNVTGACQDALLSSSDLTLTDHVNQIEGLYPGAYYTAMSVFVGPDVERSVTIMRLVNALIAAVLLSALLRLLPAGLAAAATLAIVVTFVPLGLSLVASTNPSSWSIIGIGTFWAFALAFLRRASIRDRRGILLAAAMVVSAGMAIASRVDSAAYVVVSLAVVVTLAGWRESLARPWRLTLLAALALVGAGVYLNRGQPLTGGDSTLGTADGGAGLLLTNLAHFPFLVQGAVGGWDLAWNDAAMPELVPVVGVLVLGALLYRGLQVPSGRTLVAAGIAALALVAVPVAYLQSQRLGVGEVVQPRYILPLLTVLVGVVSVGPRLARPLPLPRVPAVVVSVALSGSAVLGFWAYAHRFFAGSTVGLFDPKMSAEWASPVGVPLLVSVPVTVIASVVLVAGAVLLNSRPPARRVPAVSSATGTPRPTQEQ